MNATAIDSETPACLIPRMDDLPISNVRTFRTAVVTQVKAPGKVAGRSQSAEWTVFNSFPSGLLAISAVTVSPKGSFVAYGNQTGFLRLWDVAQQRQIGGGGIIHKARITKIAFSPDESLVASMDASGAVMVSETSTGKQYGETIAADPACGLVFHSDGPLLLRLNDGPLTFLPHGPAQDRLPVWPQAPQALALQRADYKRPDGSTGAFVQTGPKKWNEVQTQNSGPFEFDEVSRSEWSVGLHDPSRGVSIEINLFLKKILFAQGQSAKLPIYDIVVPASAPFTAESIATVTDQIAFAASDANGTLCFSTTPVRASGLRRADVGTGNQASGTYIQTGAKNWEEIDAAGATVFQFDEISRDQSSLYLHDASRDVSIQIDLSRKQVSWAKGQAAKSPLYDIVSVGAAPDAVFAARWTGDQMQIGSIRALVISTDGKLVATGGDGGQIGIWRWASGSQLTGKPFIMQSSVKDLKFSPDTSVLAALDEKGTLSTWDLSTGQVLPMYQQLPPVQAFAFSADFSVLAVVSGNATITLLRDTQDIVAQPLPMPQPATLITNGRPAEGVLLIHEQSWVMQGLALGELLHSVCLAPGEITQIAVTSHSSRTMQQSADTVSQDESLNQSSAGASSVAEQERATATEAAFGSSFAMSSGSTIQAGVSGLFASAGASANTSAALMATFSTGTRNVADVSNQLVHESAAQDARLSRRLYSAAVREVSESDNVELRTRVVANYNHMHALNVQYYEVVQVQRLRTRITDAFRLLFLPIQIVDFTDETQCRAAAARFRRELVDVARSLGLSGVSACLDLLAVGETFTTELIDYRLGEAWHRVSQLDEALTEQDNRVKEDKELCITCEDTVLGARDALRKFNLNHEDASQLERAKLQRALQAALEQSRLADERRAISVATAQRLRTDRDEAAALKAQLRTIIDPFLTDPLKPALDHQQFAAIEKLVFKSLADNQMAVNQGLWMRIDPSTYCGLLQGQAVNGEPLATSVDPTPVAIAGNYLGFRWHHSDATQEVDFRLRFVGTETMEDSIALPTSGIFGEAVLGSSNAAEKIDLTRFWNWSEALPPIRPTQIAPLKQPAAQAPAAPTLPTVAAPATQLPPMVFPHVASGAPLLADALKNPDLFRDMSGSKATAALARSAVELAAKGSSDAADIAQQNFLRQLAFQQKLAETFLDKDTTNGGGKRDLDPTLAGGIINSNPDLDAEGNSDVDDSLRELKELGATPDDSQGGDESGTDKDALQIEFIEEQ